MKKKTSAPKVARKPSKFATFECQILDNDATDDRDREEEIHPLLLGLNGKRRRDNPRGIRRLVSLAVAAVQEIEKAWVNGNEEILRIAEARIDWPVMASRHVADRNKNQAYLEDIGLASELPNYVFLGNFPANVTPIRRQTLRLLQHINAIAQAAIWGESIHDDLSQCEDPFFLETLRRRLLGSVKSPLFPTFTLTWPLVLRIKQLPSLGPGETVIKEWQNVAIEFLDLNSANNPASVPDLRPFGYFRRFHPYSPFSQNPGNYSAAKQDKNISREIRLALKREIKKVCTHSDKIKHLRPSQEKARLKKKKP